MRHLLSGKVLHLSPTSSASCSPRPQADIAQVDIVSSWRSGLTAQHSEVQTEAVKTFSRECQVRPLCLPKPRLSGYRVS